MRHYDYDFSPNVYFNLGEYGAPGYHEISQFEMQLLYRAAQSITDRCHESIQDTWLMTTQADLIEHALVEAIDPDWVGMAVLCLAVRGIRYGEIPDCIFTED